MKTIGPLMIEQRLIERMVTLHRKELNYAKTSREPDIELILRDIDFFKVYADRPHRGKEEDILFKDLAEKEWEMTLRQ